MIDVNVNVIPYPTRPVTTTKRTAVLRRRALRAVSVQFDVELPEKAPELESILLGPVAGTVDGSAEVYIEQSVEEVESRSRERSFDLLADRPLEWTFDVAFGDPAHELLDVASKRDATLIVVGGRGHTLLGALVAGSVAHKLVRSSPISVLVVRHPPIGEHLLAAQRQSTP